MSDAGFAVPFGTVLQTPIEGNSRSVEPEPEWTDEDEERAVMHAYISEAETWRSALQQIASADLKRVSAGWLRDIAQKALGEGDG